MQIEPRLYLRQLRRITVAQLKTRYRNTWSGLVWVVLNPVLLFGAQSFAFHYVLRVEVQNYPLFLVSGLLPWIFLSQSIEMCTGLFQNSGRLLKSFPIHPLVLLGAQISDNLLNFVLSLILLLIPMVFLFGVNQPWLLIWMPLVLLVLFIGVFSLCWLVSTLNVFYRDTRFVVSFIMSMSFFLTPVFYPVEFVPEKVRWLLVFNPFLHLIYPIRMVFIGQDLLEFIPYLAKGAFVALALYWLAFEYWRRKRNVVYFYL